jgi:hypothetical protein
MKNKTILKVLLWFSKITIVLILIASVTVVVVTIVSQVNPKFKFDFTPGSYAFKPVSEVTGKYLTKGEPVNFEVNSIIVDKSAFKPGLKVSAISAFSSLILLAITFYILKKMISVLNNLLRNKIFQRENALLLRKIALAMIAGWILNIILSIVLTFVFRGSLSLVGYDFQYYQVGGNIFTTSIVPGIIILIVAEVFRIGTELKEESDLTI